MRNVPRSPTPQPPNARSPVPAHESDVVVVARLKRRRINQAPNHRDDTRSESIDPLSQQIVSPRDVHRDNRRSRHRQHRRPDLEILQPTVQRRVPSGKINALAPPQRASPQQRSPARPSDRRSNGMVSKSLPNTNRLIAVSKNNPPPGHEHPPTPASRRQHHPAYQECDEWFGAE